MHVLKAVFALMLLGVPLVVITALPRFFELAGAAATPAGQTSAPASASVFRLVDPTPPGARRLAALDEPPPPTLAPPAATATLEATPRPAPSGERVIIGNTDGLGAVLRSDPVTGRAIASLPERQVVEVLEHRSVPGNGDWLHVRTTDGTEGWVTGLAALPVVTNH
jgi:Bacterial SH3 domain